jgi:peptidoglycan/LPS O-acetylase OafA/YrhL
VLAVLAFHEKLPGLSGGFLGVDVFFVISGYLITDLLATPWRNGGRLDLRGFWVRRARRLLPCLVVMLVSVTAAVAVLEPAQLPSLRPALLAAVTYTSNWWQAWHGQSYFATFGPPPPLQHLWSLAIEEQFYLVWPVVLTVILGSCRRRRARAAVAWAMAAASAIAMATGYLAGMDPSRLYYGTDTHATALLAGAALALTWPLQRVAAATWTGAWRLDLVGLAGITVLAWELNKLTGSGGALYLGGIAVAAVAGGAVVLAAAAPGMLGEILGWKPLRWVGVRSYGIYLWHWPVIALFAAREGAQASTAGARVAETVTAITLAVASWEWIEAPIMRDGFTATLRSRGRTIARPIRVAGTLPRRALPALPALAAVSVTVIAVFGLLYSPTGPTLQQQIAAGDRAEPGSSDTTASDLAASADASLSPAPGRNVTAIGDSVMLASAMALRAALPGIYLDAQVGRQLSAGVATVRRLAREGDLRPVLVVGLGTNGAITTRQVNELRSIAGPGRMLVMINTFVPRSWQSEVNRVLASAARHDQNVTLANWHAAIQDRTSLLWPDGVHPRPPGGTLYARVVSAAVRSAISRLTRQQAAGSPSRGYLVGERSGVGSSPTGRSAGGSSPTGRPAGGSSPTGRPAGGSPSGTILADGPPPDTAVTDGSPPGTTSADGRSSGGPAPPGISAGTQTTAGRATAPGTTAMAPATAAAPRGSTATAPGTGVTTPGAGTTGGETTGGRVTGGETTGGGTTGGGTTGGGTTGGGTTGAKATGGGTTRPAGRRDWQPAGQPSHRFGV